MEPNAPKTLALRLLELEQRFESYCALHDEELREISATLRQLREDILRLQRDPEAGAPAVGTETTDDGARQDLSDPLSELSL